MINTLRPVFWFDKLYLGGGNVKYVQSELGLDVVRIKNTAGILGGVRLWDTFEP